MLEECQNWAKLQLTFTSNPTNSMRFLMGASERFISSLPAVIRLKPLSPDTKNDIMIEETKSRLDLLSSLGRVLHASSSKRTRNLRRDTWDSDASSHPHLFAPLSSLQLQLRAQLGASFPQVNLSVLSRQKRVLNEWAALKNQSGSHKSFQGSIEWCESD